MVFLCQIDPIQAPVASAERWAPGRKPLFCIIRALDLHHCSELARLALGMEPDDGRPMRFMPLTDLGPHGLIWSQ